MKYKVGDFVMLKPIGKEKKPTKAKILEVAENGYLIQLAPFNRKPTRPGDDAIYESEISGLATR